MANPGALRSCNTIWLEPMTFKTTKKLGANFYRTLFQILQFLLAPIVFRVKIDLLIDYKKDCVYAFIILHFIQM